MRRVRAATSDDAHPIAALRLAYVEERFPSHRKYGADTILADALGEHAVVSLLVAERDATLVGFLAWMPTYDLQHGTRGGTVIGLYVVPALRGLGIALELVAAAAAAVQAAGGSFLHGGAYDRNGPVGRVYERIAIGFDSAECFLGGRAFRRVAALAGERARDILRGLPDRSENREP
jgi:GNAT superfamily N-acetyltransferase